MDNLEFLIACESSGILRDALIERGHRAVSCDLLPSERPGPHYQGDVRDILYRDWDGIFAFPPCTDLAVSGARWFTEKRASGEQQQSIEFFMLFARHTCRIKSIEQPVGIMSSIYRKPDQIIQPWMFGHGETKSTCLWLTGLPLLRPTKIVSGREQRIWKMAPSPDRAKERSRTFQGIADAMADQWGSYALRPVSYQPSLFNL